MTIFSLVKKGYGTLDFISSLDTPEFLKIVEYENICNDIEQIRYEESRHN